MILVDSSIWIDHFRSSNARFVLTLAQGHILQHPFVTAEIALGSIRDRERVISLFDALPQSQKLNDAALLQFVTRHNIYASGLGLVDAHLLGAAVQTNGCMLWTRDKRLAAKASELDCLYPH